MSKLNVCVDDVQKKGLTFNGNKRLVFYPKVDLKAVPRYKGTGCIVDGSFVVPCATIDGFTYRLSHENYTEAELAEEKKALAEGKESRDKALKEGVQSILDYMAEAKIVDEKLTSLVKALLPEDKKVSTARSALSKLSPEEMQALWAEMQAQMNA